MIYGYIRVSTDKQTVENQRFEITNYCRIRNLQIDKWIDETISGTISPKKRNLGKLIQITKKDDIIICSELSRLGRNMFMIMSILNQLMEKGVRVFTVKENYQLGDDISSKILAFAFSISAEIERQLISQRTKEALNRKRSEGVVLGHPKGQKNSVHKLDGKEDIIQDLLACHFSKTEICKIFNVCGQTLYNFMRQESIQF